MHLLPCVLFLLIVGTDPEAFSPKVLAVLPTENATDMRALDATSEGLADLLAVMLAEKRGVHVVERARLPKIAREQALALSGLTNNEGAALLGGFLGADCVVTSSLTGTEDALLLIANVVEAKGGRVLRTVRHTGKFRQIFELVEEVALEIAQAADFPVAQPRQEDLDNAPGISLMMIRGLSFFHEELPERALVEFMKILGHEPMHEGARLWIAKCFMAAGEQEHALAACEWFLKNLPDSTHVSEIVRLVDAGLSQGSEDADND